MAEPSPSPARELVADSRGPGLPADATTTAIAAVQAGPEAGGVTKKRLGIASWIAIGWLVLVVGGAILAPILPLPDPNEINAGLARQAPSAAHLFGNDGNGRDVLSRVTWGARASLEIGVGAVVLGLLAGGFLGLVAGYYKGRIGGGIGGLLDTLLAFPQLLLALSIVAFLGHTVFNVMLGLGIVATPLLGRISRASTLSWSEREFVLAARAQGAKHRRIIVREILPNVLPAMFSIALLGIAVAIVAEGGLAILGAGVNPSKTITWGTIIADGRSYIRDAPHMVLSVSIVIFLTVLALNYLGDVIRARFDVRESAL
jgi:peptide/nickel transport system permease protein